MTTRNDTLAPTRARGRLATALRRITRTADDYTRDTFNAQHELRRAR